MPRALLSIAALIAVFGFGCRAEKTLTLGDGGGPDPSCTSCVADSDCASGSACVQVGGDSFCMARCTAGSCLDAFSCMTVTSAHGEQVEACIPMTASCGQPMNPPADAGAPPSGNCGALIPPEVPADCTCSAGKTCAANGCYGGWYCNSEINRCQQPPNAAMCASNADGGGGPFDAGPHPMPVPLPQGTVNGGGSPISDLRFAIVGDTRPSSPNDTGGYPTSIIQRIWADVESEGVPFALTTGDYVFATPGRGVVEKQLDIYLDARAEFEGWVFAAMGNHECTGSTASNCGPGSANGMTENYQAYLMRMAGAVGATLPYYVVNFQAADGSWTAKFVLVAANAWTQDQATWLDQTLAVPTTYTFVVRHEGTTATEGPGVNPSAQIMAQHPYTLLLAGHTHTFAYYSGTREVIIGNGGAPITGSVNYGYVTATRQSDGTIHFAAKDYVTKSAFHEFTVKADGTFAQ
jgi:hypothetical protein